MGSLLKVSVVAFLLVSFCRGNEDPAFDRAKRIMRFTFLASACVIAVGTYADAIHPKLFPKTKNVRDYSNFRDYPSMIPDSRQDCKDGK